jgi:hypothetical protein
VHDVTPTSASRARQGTLGVATLIGLLLTGVVLAACSSSPSSSATTTTGASSGTTATTSSSSSGGGSSDASKIQSLSSSVQAGQHATFKAVYTTHSATAASQTITIEQMPPKSVFGTTSGSVINDGTHTYFCSSSGGTSQCVSESATAGSNPLKSITALFDPATILSEFQAAQSAAAAHSLGYSFAFSSETYAGVPTKCVNFTHAAESVKYCVTDSGILAYASSAGNTFELTNFTSSPAASDFSLPAGATVITVPSIPGQ